MFVFGEFCWGCKFVRDIRAHVLLAAMWLGFGFLKNCYHEAVWHLSVLGALFLFF